MSALGRLSARELEICMLHFVDGRSQSLIAEWFHIDTRVVERHLQSAVAKVPQLKPLQTQSRAKPKHVRVLHLSQLPGSDCHGPFNIDEL
jgi:hypothetical protein